MSDIQKTDNGDILADREKAIQEDEVLIEAKAAHQKIIDEVESEGYTISEVILRAMHYREEKMRLAANKKFSEKKIWPFLAANQKERN